MLQRVWLTISTEYLVNGRSSNSPMSPASTSSQPLRMGASSFLYSHQQQRVWIQESSVDDSLRTLEYESEVAQFLDQFHGAHEPTSTGPQTTLLDHSASLIHRSDHFVILAVPDERAADALPAYLPRFWKAAPIPVSPVSFFPVPETAVKRVRDLLASLRFDPLAAGIIGGAAAKGNMLPY